MKVIALAVVALAAAVSAGKRCDPSITTASGTFAPDEICPGDLVFEDNFDTLNPKKWQHENSLAGGGNWEFQWYSNHRKNSFVENGILHLKPSLTNDELDITSVTLDLNGGAPADYCTNAGSYGCSRTGSPSNVLNPAKSARLQSTYSFSFRYGRIEVRAKIPSGDWLWPAIWMMPRDNAYGSWPQSGEIDIMESRGNKNLVDNGVNIGTQMVGSTMHWGTDYFHNEYMRTHWDKSNSAGYDSDFHVYGMLWTPDGITFSVDGADVGSVTPPAGGFWELGQLGSSGQQNPWRGQSKMAPFDQEFYIILNLAVGGIAYFPDSATNPSPKPWSNESPTASSDFWNGRNDWLPTWNLDSGNDGALKVDYVRVYAL